MSVTKDEAKNLYRLDILDHFEDVHEIVAEQPSHPSSRAFYEELIDLGILHAEKQADYGRVLDPFANVRASEDFGVAPWIGAMNRANDKMRRIQAHAQRGNLTNENVRDSFRDLCVYTLIALVLFEEEQDERSSSGPPVRSTEEQES